MLQADRIRKETDELKTETGKKSNILNHFIYVTELRCRFWKKQLREIGIIKS